MHQHNAQFDLCGWLESAERTEAMNELKQLTTHTLVFMIREIIHNWKQVIKISIIIIIMISFLITVCAKDGTTYQVRQLREFCQDPTFKIF